MIRGNSCLLKYGYLNAELFFSLFPLGKRNKLNLNATALMPSHCILEGSSLAFNLSELEIPNNAY